MPSILPRLICIDLDRTLLPVDSRRIPDGNLRALAACAAAGIELAVISGRRRTTLEPYIEQIGLPLFVGSNSGTQLWSFPDWQALDSKPLPPALLKQAVELLEPHSLNLYFGWDDNDRRDFAWLRRAESELHSRYIREFGTHSTTVSSLAELPQRDILQLSMPAGRELVLELRELLNSRLGEDCFAECVNWPRMPCHALELFHADGHKGWALQRFAQLRGIPPELTMAVGDDTNDLPMLRAAGHAVAMGHSVPEALRIADTVLPDEGEEALGEFLLSLLS